MRKRYLSALLFLSCSALAGCVLASCGTYEGDVLQTSDRNILSIDIVEGSVPAYVLINHFDEAGIKLRVSYSDGTSEILPVTSAFVPQKYRHLLEKEGDVQIEILYRGNTTAINLHIVAEYHTVTFKAYVSSNAYETVASYDVAYLASAEAPSVPQDLVYGGYHYYFRGWDTDFSHVTRDLVVSALYESIECFTVTFHDGYGNSISAQTVDWGNNAVEPDEGQRDMFGYDFVGWDRSYSNVTKDLDIYGVYVKVTENDPEPMPVPVPSGYDYSEDSTCWNYYATPFSIGSGSETDPYLITKPEELAYLSKISVYSANTAGKYFVLNGDVDMAGHEWIPIGRCVNTDWSLGGFAGHFDGHGFNVYNLSVTRRTVDGYAGGSYIGLFGWAFDGAEIKNVNVFDYQFNLGFEVDESYIDLGLGYSDHLYIGGVVGELRQSYEPVNCSSSGVCTFNGHEYALPDVGVRYDVISPQSPVSENPVFYLSGTFNGWSSKDEDYAFTYSETDGCYILNYVTLGAGAGIKVMDSDGLWYPDGIGNDYSVQEGGMYDVHFDPKGGHDGWHYGYFEVVTAE